MKAFYRIILVAVAAAICASCGVYVSLEPEANEYWQGKTHAEIVKTYGAPVREMSDGQGGVILVYEDTKTEIHTSVNNNSVAVPVIDPYYGGIYGFYYDFGPRTTNTRTETKTDYAHFYIGADKICYKVETNLEKYVEK